MSADIKIGDLGLARFSTGHFTGDDDGGEDLMNMKESRSMTADSDDRSAQVGTFLYLAPEGEKLSEIRCEKSRDCALTFTQLYLVPKVLHGGEDLEVRS